MSLDTFRNQILSNSSEGNVEVNQRNLIDKILARYSCKFVIYRELMQNSDDAESSSVKIIFETNGSKITRILFKNNGFAFRPEDWNRLVKITEGNPDEQKIGAFGVGFYSLFSVSENPFVSSGGQGMAFYWRGNQVFTKQGPIDDDDKGWTTFLMDTRKPLEIPNIEEFARFLVNSLGFTENLQEISMYIDDVLIIQLSKKMQEPKLVEIASDLNTFSPKNMFHLTSVDFRGVQLDVKRLLIPTKLNIKQLRSHMYQTLEESILFRIANGNLDVKVSKEFSAKMERITKKKPPNNTFIQMIYSEFDERNLSKDDNKDISPIYKDLISYPEQGKIYIGFPTNQTTGSCSHLAARVIPTMERELIDFAEPTLAEYNNEMLCLAGTLSRILYEYEMAQITNFYNEIISSDIENNEETKRPEKSTSKSRSKRSLYKWLKKRVLHFSFEKRTSIVQMTQYDDEKISPYRKWLEKWAACAIAHFTYNTGTPNMQVSTIAETQFSSCLKQNLLILSTHGVLPISNVRLPNPKITGFIKTIPLVPKNMLEQCNLFFNKAKEVELIAELGLQDVLDELIIRTLSEEEIIKLLKWWISYLLEEDNFDTQLLKFAQIGDSSQTLNTIQFYSNPNKIPLDMSIPFEVLPNNISKNFTGQELENRFGWTELPLVNWAKFIVKKSELESDFEFAEKVHHVIAKNLEDISQEDKETIRQLFVEKKCIPTKFGMKFPNESYFQSVDLFPNLPTIKFQDFTSSVRRLMEHFGVRMFVELQLILERLVNQEDCYYIQIIKYLASILDDLSEDEKDILKNKSIWPRENLSGSQSAGEIQRFVARDLYIPLRSHRELGLHLIDWNVEWSNSSKEGKFLIELGLRKHPNLETIIKLAASPTDPKIRELALKYFIDNFDIYSQFYKPEEVNIAFLPCSDTYAKPSECYVDDKCTIMNFQIIREDLRSEAENFGVRQHPNHEKLVKRLTKNPPQNKNKAKEIFKYLSSQQEDFTDSDWDTLNNFEFIPIQDVSQSDEIINKLIKPRECLFKLKEESLNDFFPCVDFGTKANKFLAKCGVKYEPTSADFVRLSVNSSHKLWKLYLKKYLNILEIINPNLEIILELSAPPIDPKIREMSLKYFIDNFDNRYSKYYKPEDIDIAFLPCSNSNTYAKPSECFIDDRCMIMNFETIREDLRSKRSKVEKFGVRQHPNHEKLVKSLTENPPQNEDEARKVFEYLDSQQHDFTDSDWDTLNNFEFIPIKNENQSNEIINKLIKPRDCFFKEESLNEFFPCVDFGTNANRFLSKCGVNNEPSSADFARLLVNSPNKLWNLYKNDITKYLEKIKFNENLDNITSEKKKDDDNLIAIKIGHKSKGNDDYYLALVKEIYINDDKVYQQVLNPLVAPKNLESLYKKLGCKSLYESVTKSVVPHGRIQKTKYSQQLQRIIRERASLFYLNYSEEEIKNDNKWLKKLKVREVEYMETSYKLESITKNERKIITTNIKENTNSWTLYVTSNSNLIDISQNILSNIFKSYNSKDISYFNTILTAPLSSLKHMGIFEPELPIFSLLKDDQQSQQQDGSEDIDIKSFENEKPITITSENTQDLRNLLQYSIKSRYSNSESNINSSNIKGLTKTCINESQVNSCDIIPGYSMRCVGNSQKIELYVSNGIDQSEILSQSRIAPLSQFINILKDLADVFEITPKAIHIFYDNSVNSIAFNRDGALFFNLKFYIGLHEQECKSKPTIDAMTYWFMMFCHVLAHNFVQLHNSEFEYYYSSFAKIYMPNFLEKMKKREITLRSFNIKTFWKNFSRILTRT
ncbi:unnamed protein product [Rhizophagus irregularis]|nr:unnamed protein product [Rhizophagus irregularis]